MNWAQRIHDATLAAPTPGWWGRLKGAAVRRCAARLTRASEPVVTQCIWEAPLQLPFSHTLPWVLKWFPDYSSHVLRIAQLVEARYPGAAFIDVGANIGDTIANIRRGFRGPILGIEGDPRYFALLERNAAQFRDVQLVQSFVGERPGALSVAVKKARGTAWFERSSQETVTLRTLPDILAQVRPFEQAKILKVDTDGFDGQVLRGSGPYLDAAKPVVLFEYDPDLWARQGDAGLSLFPWLRSLGYDGLLVYDNFGDLLLSSETSAARILEDLHDYFSGRGGDRYMDLWVFHETDAALFKEARESERRHFQGTRPPKRPT